MTTAAALTGSILADPASLPPLPHGELDRFGPTLVAAPHPDDESLGSGGLIALLRDRGVPVRVLVLTDGTGSHPTSRAYPAPRLRELREAEALAAVDRLGLGGPDAVTFFRQPDRYLALPGEPGHAELVERCRAFLDVHAIRTVVTTWRRDPHRDHRAAWRIMADAVARARVRPRLLEVPIWLWVRAAPGDAPRDDEALAAWRLDVAAVLGRKRAAVAAHRSQTSELIDDDPQGFPLAPEMLAYFDRPFEVYLEERRP